jgi:hypothetical protein
LSNTIEFTAASGVTSVTITVALGSISDFLALASINRLYTINVTGSSYTANLRLHYNDNELNGNLESTMTLWRYNGSVWVDRSKFSANSSSNFVQLNGISDLSNRWTISDIVNIVTWNGSVNTQWSNASNWTSVSGSPTPPSSNDIVYLGSTAFTNQPAITSPVVIRGVVFYNTTPTTLSINSGGSLTCAGNVSGKWTSTATHTLNIGAQAMSVGGELIMGDGTANDKINVSISTGSLTVTNNLFQRSSANLTFSGNGSLNIGGDYSYTNGIFTPSTSTVIYNGSLIQQVAPLNYYDLNITKPAGTANLTSATSVANNLSISTGGQLDVNANLDVAGNFAINTNTIVNSEGSIISVGGNWTRAGTFIQGSGTVIFNGTGTQYIDGTTFNSFTINKSANVAYANGNISINGDLSVMLGTLDLLSYSANRTALGGTLTLATGTVLNIGGASNFPSNFDSQTISNASTVNYNSTVVQSVPQISYGNITFSNGGSNKKALTNNITVSGDLTINSGARFDENNYTVELYGNWINSGTFTSSSGTVKLSGNTKTISGTNTFYNLSLPGSYATLAGTVTTVLNKFTNAGTFTQGSDSIYLYGDYINTGTLVLNGVTNIMGQKQQTLTNNGTLTSLSSGVINYNGTVSPLIFSSTPPQYATVNINNTAGVAPVQPWSIFVAMNVGSGATFSGNGMTHTFYGSFSNKGTVINPSGNFVFIPSTATSINFGNSFSCGGTVSFQGTGAISIAGSGSPTFGAIGISNKHSNGITPSSNWSITGNITIRDTSVFHAGTSLTHTIGGNITTNGIFDGGTSTVILDDTTSIGGVGTTTFHNLIINSVDTALTNFNVSGNFTNNGSFDPTGYAVTFTGSNPSIIGGTKDTTSFADLIISKTSGSVTLASRVRATDDVTVNTGSTFSVANSEMLLEGNVANDGIFTGTSLGSIKFMGTNSQIISGSVPANFPNVTVENSAGIVFSTEHNVTRVLTLTSGIVSSSVGLLNLNLDYGAISTSGSGSISGNLKVTKTVGAKGYHYLASPFSGRTVADWDDDLTFSTGRYYHYDETQVSSNNLVGWTSLANTSVALSQTKGYALYFPTASTSVDMIGTYTHGASPANVNLSRTYSGPNGADGWNLVGNPFPSPIDWDAASGWTNANIYRATYFWNPATSSYATYINGLGLLGATRYIPAMQAFWVRVDTSTTANKSIPFGMTSAVRVTSVGATPTLWRSESENNMLKLNVSNGSLYDETVIRLVDQSTNRFDGRIDAYKMMNDPKVASFYSILNGDKYSVNSIPPNYAKNVIPLALKVSQTGEYTISAENIGAFDQGIDIILTDTLLGTHTDLGAQPSYNFRMNKEDSLPRFFLNFNYSRLVTSTSGKVEGNIYIRNVDKTINVDFAQIESTNAEIVISDCKGQAICNEKTETSTTYTKRADELPAGMYIVRVIAGSLVKIEKVIID